MCTLSAHSRAVDDSSVQSCSYLCSFFFRFIFFSVIKKILLSLHILYSVRYSIYLQHFSLYTLQFHGRRWRKVVPWKSTLIFVVVLLLCMSLVQGGGGRRWQARRRRWILNTVFKRQ